MHEGNKDHQFAEDHLLSYQSALQTLYAEP